MSGCCNNGLTTDEHGDIRYCDCQAAFERWIATKDRLLAKKAT